MEPNPSQTPNPQHGPARPLGRRDGGNNLRDAIWFIVGMILVGLSVCALGVWFAMSPIDEEADDSVRQTGRIVEEVLQAQNIGTSLTLGPSPNAGRGRIVDALIEDYEFSLLL